MAAAAVAQPRNAAGSRLPWETLVQPCGRRLWLHAIEAALNNAMSPRTVATLDRHSAHTSRWACDSAVPRPISTSSSASSETWIVDAGVISSLRVYCERPLERGGGAFSPC